MRRYSMESNMKVVSTVIEVLMDLRAGNITHKNKGICYNVTLALVKRNCRVLYFRELLGLTCNDLGADSAYPIEGDEEVLIICNPMGEEDASRF